MASPKAVFILDDFLESEGWPHIDVIKMDIEGAEVLAFNGMQRLCKRQDTLKLIFEFNPYRLDSNDLNPWNFFKDHKLMVSPSMLSLKSERSQRC